MSPTTISTARAPKPFYRTFGFQVLAAMVLGLVLGYIARQIGPDANGAANWLTQTLSTVGSIFVQLLRALVPVLVFTAIVASIANLRELNNAAKLVWQTLLWFAITALIAVAIGIALGLIIQPGIHTAVAETAAKAPSSTGSWLDFLKGLIPANILGLAASTSVTDGGAPPPASTSTCCRSWSSRSPSASRRCRSAGGRSVPGVQPLLPRRSSTRSCGG